MRLLDADYLLKIFDEKCKRHCDDCGYFDNDFHCKLIADVPEVELAKWQYEYLKKIYEKVRPLGEWIFEKANEERIDGYICSNCKCSFHTKVPYFSEFNFCPNCGAKMKRGVE